MSVLQLVPRDSRIEVWISGGLDHWRVTSAAMTYGEFAEINDARAFLHLLVKGNPERFKWIE